MRLGRVCGTVVSTLKDPKLSGQRLLLIQPLTAAGLPGGRRLVATDTARAGEGDLVLWVRGKEAAFALLPDDVVTDACVVGVVESQHMPAGTAR